ncbi:MAG: response regulator [Nitrospirae bacterium]|nr:response regulator [Nitrospirota bacterium]
MENSKGKILIVEDEKGMRDVLQILLEGEDYTVMATSGGEDGLSCINNDTFDLVITDIKMPRVDGFEILKKVKEVSPDTLVIMITAFGTTESAIEAMKLGAYDYIHKPFEIDEIRLIVKKAIEKKKLREELTMLKKQIKTSEETMSIPELQDEGIDLNRIIETIEKNYLLKAIEKTGGVKTEAARLLNLSFRSFRHRLQKYGIK